MTKHSHHSFSDEEDSFSLLETLRKDVEAFTDHNSDLAGLLSAIGALETIKDELVGKIGDRL